MIECFKCKPVERREFLEKSLKISTVLLSTSIVSKSLFAKQENIENPELLEIVDNIFWIEQAAVKIKSVKSTIYIDPFKIKNEDTADIIFITHSHNDHLSLSDIGKVATEKTVFVAPEECLKKIKRKYPSNQLINVKPGMKNQVLDIQFEAVHAYNITKTNFHPKSNNWVGYIVTVNGIRIYHAGDTERVPEMKNFNCDIAMVPLGQKFTMNTVEDAVESVKDTHAKIAIPIHFGLYEGTTKDAEKFKDILGKSVKVIIKSKA